MGHLPLNIIQLGRVYRAFVTEWGKVMVDEGMTLYVSNSNSSKNLTSKKEVVLGNAIQKGVRNNMFYSNLVQEHEIKLQSHLWII